MSQICRFAYTIHFAIEALCDDDHKQLIRLLSNEFKKKGGFQYEKTGELHAQGHGTRHITDKVRVDTLGQRLNTEWKEYKWFKNIHLSAESNNSVKKNALNRYDTKKDSTYVSGPYEWNIEAEDEFKDTYDLLPKVLWPWQKTMIDIINCFFSDRGILWFEDEYTNLGKSRALDVIEKERILLKDRNRLWRMKAQGDNEKMSMLFIDNVIDHKKYWPSLLLIDIPKSTGLKPLHWDGFYEFIEQVKAGFVQCGRYKGGGVTNKTYVCNIVVTSNKAPKYVALGRNRITHYKSVFINESLYDWVKQ